MSKGDRVFLVILAIMIAGYFGAGFIARLVEPVVGILTGLAIILAITILIVVWIQLRFLTWLDALLPENDDDLWRLGDD